MSQYVSVAGLKCEGWTEGLIAKYLGDPDSTAPNPHYSQAGAPMRLYLRVRVAKKLKTKRVQMALADAAVKRQARRQAAARGISTKISRAETRMANAVKEQLEQVLSGWTWPRLVRAACASYNRGDGIPYWAYGKRDWADNHCGGATAQSDPEFLERICCNFVRHQLLCYDGMLGGYVGSAQARDVAHDAVFQAVIDLQALTPEQEQERDRRWRLEQSTKREQEAKQREQEEKKRLESEHRIRERAKVVANFLPWASSRQILRIAERVTGPIDLQECLLAAKALGFYGDKPRWDSAPKM